MTQDTPEYNKYLVCIAGPTGVGKSELALRLASHFDSEIISCDSRQLYAEMKIGTARPTADQMDTITHHMVGSISIHDSFSTGDYERMVLPIISRLFEIHDIVLLVGGTGLYFKAITEGLDQFPDVPAAITEDLNQLLQERGIEILQDQLKEKDPEYFKTVDIHNPHRLIRALGVIQQSGQPYSSFLQKEVLERPFKVIPIFVNMDREILYDRINRRVRKMMEIGQIEEAKELYPFKNIQALHTVGYKELMDYFDGLHSLEEAIQLIQRNSRRYAKRQITWYRNQGQWIEMDINDFESIVDLVQSYIK